MNSEKLTIADVERLLSDPSENARAQVAAKVARQFADVELLPRERELAHEILGYLVHDVAISVRESLARCLTDNASAPRSIVSPSRSARPAASSSGRNWAGSSNPRRGCCQRTRHSSPVISPVSVEICGWK